MITKADAILSLAPNSEFSIVGSGIDGVVTWISPSHPPVSEEQIRIEYEKLVIDEPNKTAKQKRALAYREEADPIFFKTQRGEATHADWILKVNEIRDRYPYSE